MSTSLEQMGRTYSARMKAHSAMLVHLNLDPSEEEAPHLFDELRHTVITCARCQCPRSCTSWIEDGQAGPPPWCSGMRAFETLALACQALKDETARSAEQGDNVVRVELALWSRRA
jgi:hypothetical protein